MKLSRRDALWAGLGGLASATLANPLFAATVEELTAGFTGGAGPRCRRDHPDRPRNR